jgi:hypothetical protein
VGEKVDKHEREEYAAKNTACCIKHIAMPQPFGGTTLGGQHRAGTAQQKA